VVHPVGDASDQTPWVGPIHPSGHPSMLFDDLRIARTLRRRPMQTFLIVRKSLQFFFQVQVLFAGCRRPAHAGKTMVFRSHRPIFRCVEHRVSSHASVLARLCRSERRGTLKRVPSMQVGRKPERFALAFRSKFSLYRRRDKVERELPPRPLEESPTVKLWTFQTEVRARFRIDSRLREHFTVAPLSYRCCVCANERPL
jgi:hypothetical protein